MLPAAGVGPNGDAANVAAVPLSRPLMPLPRPAAVALPALALAVGCAAPSVPPTPIPPADEAATVTYDPPRPLPAEPMSSPLIGGAELRPEMSDVRIYEDRLAQEPAYVAAYDAVGRPTVAVYVNRTFDGRVIPAELPAFRRTDRYEADVQIDRRPGGFGASGGYGRVEPIEPIDRRPETDRFDRARDELGATPLDLSLIETILTDRLSAGGAVRLQSPAATRRQLPAAAIERLESGEPTALGEVAERLDADVLVHAAARPTLQTTAGPQYRVIAEAIDTRSGASLGRAAVDVPPPLDKVAVNRYTAYVAAKLMDDLAESWTVMRRTPEQQP